MNQDDSTNHALPPAPEPEIAIIGMAGRFPGADDVAAFWNNIRDGVESFTVFSDEDLLAAGEDPAVFSRPEYVRSRPVLSDIRGFDATFFGVSPREATLADPQQLLFTEAVWQALESAGYGTPEGRGEVGVFAGMNISTYLLTRPNAFKLSVEIDGLMAGNDKDALATNVSYRLDLRGPSVTVQTFCSTSLVAVHLACASLRRGECDMAVAGGVSIRIPDRTGYLYQEGNQASPDGHVRTFDADARGSMFGDGVAVVALKRLDRALADRDTVLAVVRGSAINNDGALKFSFQAPSLDGQRRCVSAAIASAGVQPGDISYVEAHGTATEVGDPMEVAALTSAFGQTPDKQYCLLGSVKPNVGHLDRASGVTGLIKVVQSLRHELIPGTRNFTKPNPEIDFDNSPFRVTAETTPWPRQAWRPRLAGLSSLGTGGTNSHAIIAESPMPVARPARSRKWQVLPVSARTAAAAEQACDRLAEHLSGAPGLDLGDVAYTLQVGRKVFGHRKVVVSDDLDKAAIIFGEPGSPFSRVDTTVGRRVGFLIAGVGEQYPGMVADLYAEEPGFAETVDECVAILGLTDAAQLSDMFVAGSRADTPDLARLLGREASSPRAGTANSHLVQPAVFVAEYALARQLMQWGVQPEILVGYSLGEYVAACLSGVLSLPDALRLVAYRAKLIATLGEGAMLAVAGTEAQLRAVLGQDLAGLDVAIRTGSQLVLAGPIEAVEAAAGSLLAAGVSCQQLQTSHAYHSRMLLPAAEELTGWITDNVTLNAPRIPYVSNVTGELATAELVTDPGYWARHMCQTVEFGKGLSAVLRGGNLALAEIGPGQSLGALTRSHPDCAQSQWPLIVMTLPGAADRRAGTQTLAQAIGRLWLTGVAIDWPALHGNDLHGADLHGNDLHGNDPHGSDRASEQSWQPGRVPLPTYPFERQEHWLEAEQAGPAGPVVDENDPVSLLRSLPLLPESRWINLPIWRQTAPRQPRTGDRNWLILTDQGRPDSIAAALRGQLDKTGARVSFVRPGTGFAVEADGLRIRPGSAEDAAAALRHLAGQDQAPDRVVHLWTLAERDEADHLDRGLHTLIALARGAGELGLGSWLLDVVSHASTKVLAGDPVIPERATLLGPCRLIPVEYPAVRTRLIDIDSTPAASAQQALLAELRADPADQVVGMRAGQRWVPDYDVLDTGPDLEKLDPTGVSIRQGGSYLVTGGLGGIGLAMAERLVRDYSARLVLMGRTAVPPQEHWAQILKTPATSEEVRRRLEGLQRLRLAGAEFVTVAGDVSEPGDVRQAVRAAIERFGELNGVLHCAGVPAAGLMQFKTASDIAKVLAPKLAGTRAIAQAVDGLQVDFVALFSSTTSVTGGGAGQVDYCAANAFLDAFASSDALPNCFVTSIDWGEWTYNGWTTGLQNYDQGSVEFFTEYRATYGVSFEQGWQTLLRVLASRQPHVVISTQDFPTIVRMSRRSSIASHQATVKKARDALGRAPRPELSTSFTEAQTPAEQAIAGVWREALGLEQVGIHDNFFELGGNSLIGMEIIAEVRKALELPHLPPHLLYQAPTVALLAEAASSETDQDQPTQTSDAEAQQRSRIEQRRSNLRSRRMQ